MNKIYLFACGTLRKDFAPKPGVELTNLVFVGTGRVSGQLYDLGAYPGAVRGEGTIEGDLFEVQNADNALAALDAYEGDEFKREKVIVTLTGGEKTEAYMYRYAGDVTGKRRIGDGDYLAYLKTKDSLR